MNIGIIGVGIVGGALKHWLETKTKCILHLFDPDKGFNDSMDLCQVVFICVPVPADKNHEQDISKIVSALAKVNNTADVIIRSTVLPSTCDLLTSVYGKHCYSMPEFLTERTYLKDMEDLPIITGYKRESVLKLLFPDKKIIMLENKEAELAKYMHNCFCATKVNYFNILKRLCEHLNISFDNTKVAANITGFLGDMHMQVPGPDGFNGYGGKCFPLNMELFNNYLTKTFMALGGIHNLNSVITCNDYYRNDYKNVIKFKK